MHSFIENLMTDHTWEQITR